MEQATPSRTAAGLMAGNAALFGLGALLHAGVSLGPISEPPIPPAVVGETVCGLTLIAGAFAAMRPWGRPWAIAANLIAVLGVAVGTLALCRGAAPFTALNGAFHLTMVALGLAALWRLRRNPMKPTSPA